MIANVLQHAHKNNEVLYFARLEVSKAFCTGSHPRILLTAYKRGVSISVIKSIRDMNKKLNAKFKVTISPSTVELAPSIPVKKKGIRQGAVISPPLLPPSIKFNLHLGTFKGKKFERGLQFKTLNHLIKDKRRKEL